MPTIKDPNQTNAWSSLLAALFVFSIQHVASANILTVTSPADDGGANTLRSLVSAANPIGDTTIVFSDLLKGLTITLLNSEIVINKNLTISGPSDASITIIGGNTISPLNKRVFHVTSPAPDPTRIFQVSGLQMQGSIVAVNGANGTAISPAGGSGANPGELVIDYGGGGAIYCEDHTLLVASNCYFLNCLAKGGNGGDAYNTNCSPDAIGGWGGSAGGGAIFSDGDCFLYNCSFYTNTAVGGAGGTGAQGGVGGTGGDGIGGAIAVGYLGGTDLRIINCTFYGNVAYGGDGGVGGTRIFCTVTNADGGTGGSGGNGKGGAIFDHQAVKPPTGIIHSTVCNNFCYRGTGGTGGTGIFDGLNGANGGVGAASGCGLYILGIGVSAGNNLFADNHALPTTAVPIGPDVWGNLGSIGYNLVATDDGTCHEFHASDLRGTVALPINALLGPFQNNGGDMPTIALQQGSPAMDAGTTGGFPLDEIGQMRPVRAALLVPPVGGDWSDIGAFEAQCGIVSPRLEIFRNGNSVTVKWPAPSFCSKLQSSLDLINWSDYLGAVAIFGDMHQVFLNGQAGPVFYRLVPR